VVVLGAPFECQIPVTEQRILATTPISPERDTKMPDEEWIKTLEDGRKVKFIYQELPGRSGISIRSACR
jgi:hypothetical protein